MKRLFLIIVLLSFLCPSTAVAQNPFLDQGKDNTETERTETEISPPTFLQKVPRFVVIWQKELRARMSTFALEIRERPFGSSFWLFLLLAFLYGVIHAAGPGHGKTVVASYFMNRPGSVRDGVVMANLIAFFHVASATVIIVTVYLVLKKSGMSSFEEASPTLHKISYLLLLLLGLYLFSRTLYELVKGKYKNDRDSQGTAVRGGILVTALAAGIIPCPGAAIILTFTMIIGIIGTGLLSMVFIALGMGLTVSVTAVSTVLLRRTVFRSTQRNPKVFTVVYGVLSFTGSILLISLSGLLLLYYLR
ncbi:MAG: hypothetical protein JW984_11065 [Deltaproteobacteria bacterium]|uniref:Nickel/cobalt efflux system n=1 Tax=Candidatus Zymogenus saltonus TaxID=2844893 RepID=A0A9D8PNX3_9DELT|nr:hypothetical protein [Candidatus Zymogenus saltonus]